MVDKRYNALSNFITITVGDEYVHFDNHRGIQRTYDSPYLFTLNGQATTKGTPDYNIYFSMNRVIYPYSSTSRTGIGLCKAVIRADCEGVDAPDDTDLTGAPGPTGPSGPDPTPPDDRCLTGPPDTPGPATEPPDTPGPPTGPP